MLTEVMIEELLQVWGTMSIEELYNELQKQAVICSALQREVEEILNTPFTIKVGKKYLQVQENLLVQHSILVQLVEYITTK